MYKAKRCIVCAKSTTYGVGWFSTACEAVDWSGKCELSNWAFDDCSKENNRISMQTT